MGPSPAGAVDATVQRRVLAASALTVLASVVLGLIGGW
jgi:hypothetical protein